MVKEKACLNCKRIYVGDKCPNCGETPASDSFKGKIYVFNSKESEMANNMKIYSEGEFAIKTK
ncbi:MAG: transcription elongation factor subunit Spt4 [Candidatus Pacearchaeota archaeon]